MAKKITVWGIDIGNTSLKALRCTLADETGKVEALACDFIEHSKVLSLPGTDATEIIAETLETFLSRNETKGDRIAISVSGQNTISRFLPLPPVDPKKIPDVIRYEAKQWLPFDINDVVFDFQPIAKPEKEESEDGDDDDDDDFDIDFDDTIVGMFAIKKDVASKALAPYLHQSVDIDSIQSSPIALFNFVSFDQLSPAAAKSSFDDTPAESTIALCVGTDATDVVITNGETIWLRNLPLGGNSFTKALIRELQLTFSKAEYLKRNISQSKDVNEQKRVIKAMRPVFNDMVNEVNRSLEYYQTLNRKAKFQKIVLLGNAAKLPGLRQFVSQNLGYEVVRLNQFNNLIGSDVIDSQLFRDNLLSFGICFGLAVQQLGIASLRTNLIPREVIFDRIVREKKPWVVAAAAALLLGVTIQFAGVSSAHSRIHTDAFKRAGDSVQRVQTFSQGLRSGTSNAVSAFNSVDEIGRSLTSNVEGRLAWLELLRAVNAALPQSQPNATREQRPTTSENFAKIDRVFIQSIESVTADSLSAWFEPLRADNRYYPDDEELGLGDADSMESASASSSDGSGDEASEDGGSATVPRPLTEAERFAQVTGPIDDGPAKIVQLVGYHYHNPADVNEAALHGGEAYLRQTLLRNLKFGELELPPTREEQDAGTPKKLVTMAELGISHPVLLYVRSVVETRVINPDLLNPQTGELPNNIVIDPQFQTELSQGESGGRSSGRGSASSGRGSSGAGATQQPGTTPLSVYARSRGVAEPIITLRRFDFEIQFAWKETLPSQRIKESDTEHGGESESGG